MSPLLVSGVGWGSGRLKKYQKGCFEPFFDLQTPSFWPGSYSKILKPPVTWRHISHTHAIFDSHLSSLAEEKTCGVTPSVFFCDFSSKKCLSDIIMTSRFFGLLRGENVSSRCQAQARQVWSRFKRRFRIYSVQNNLQNFNIQAYQPGIFLGFLAV